MLYYQVPMAFARAHLAVAGLRHRHASGLVFIVRVVTVPVASKVAGQASGRVDSFSGNILMDNFCLTNRISKRFVGFNLGFMLLHDLCFLTHLRKMFYKFSMQAQEKPKI